MRGQKPWNIYHFDWSIFWYGATCVNGNNLKTAHSKMTLTETKLYCVSSFNNNNKKYYKRFFSNYDSTFVLLGEREELENFLNFNKRSGRGRGRGSRFWKNVKNSVQLTRTQSKFDAYRLFCHNKFTRRKVNTKFAFEQEITFFAFKWRHCNALKVQEKVS